MKNFKKIFVQNKFIFLTFLVLLLILLSALFPDCKTDNTPSNNSGMGEPPPVSNMVTTDEPEPATNPPPIIENSLPEGFSYIDSSIIIELRYATSYNFTGAPVSGYEAQVGIMTDEGYAALLEAERLAEKKGYRLKLYDAYRPVKAVESFVAWAGNDDESMKEIFYPNVSKSELVSKGYISSKSGHSRGSTVDVTLVDIDTLADVDMGSSFDFFDPISNFFSDAITSKQQANRNALRDIMEQCGFHYYKNEWWHYTLNDEPFPDTYFDFTVE